MIAERYGKKKEADSANDIPRNEQEILNLMGDINKFLDQKGIASLAKGGSELNYFKRGLAEISQGLLDGLYTIEQAKEIIFELFYQFIDNYIDLGADKSSQAQLNAIRSQYGLESVDKSGLKPGDAIPLSPGQRNFESNVLALDEHIKTKNEDSDTLTLGDTITGLNDIIVSGVLGDSYQQEMFENPAGFIKKIIDLIGARSGAESKKIFDGLIKSFFELLVRDENISKQVFHSSVDKDFFINLLRII